MDTKTQKTESEQDFTARTTARVTENYSENPSDKTGGEVEDAIQKSETHEAAGNEVAEKNFENIYEDAKVEAEKDTLDTGDREALIGVELQNSPLAENEDDFKPAIDTDFSPHQGEVASSVVKNPADLVFGVDRPRRIRDRNLPEDFSAFEYALKKEMVFPDVDGPHNRQDFVQGETKANETHRRPKPRYLGFLELDGPVFHAMGSPTATQLNTGTPVGEEKTADQFFFEFFNGGKKASMTELSPAVSTLFNADPLMNQKSEEENGIDLDEIEINDGEYEIAVDSGRDTVYDLTFHQSNAVSRKEAIEKWENDLGESIPTNQNYGLVKDFTEIQGVEDFVEIVKSRPTKLAPVVDAEQIKLGDEFEERSLAHYQAENDLEIEGTWAIFDQNRENMNLEALEEERKYEGKVLLDGEFVDVTVDHSEMDDGEFMELMDDYFDIQNTMVRPDVAPKTNGVVEFRDFSHSNRTYQALLTQKAMMNQYEEVQQKFFEAGVDSETAEDFREEAVSNGLDAEMPDYTTPLESQGTENGTLREFYRFELLPVLEDGVRDSFSEDTPYVVQKMMGENEEYDDFEEDVLSQFDTMGEFLEHQDLTDEVDYDPSSSEYSDEAEAFADWFTETAYCKEMEHWLDPDTPTVNEELRDEANRNGPDAAVNLKERASQSSYEAV